MTRVVGVVATLLCLLSAVPAAAVNVVPPGWKELAGSGSADGLSDNANINEGASSATRSVSTAVSLDGRPIVVYRDNNASTGRLEILVRQLSNASTWEPLGGALNVTAGDVFDPRVKVGANGDIFVAWRQQVDTIALYLVKWNGTDAWVPLPGSDPDGRVPTPNTISNPIKAFSLALTPDARPILAFQSFPEMSFNSGNDDPQIAFDQIFVVRWDGSSWPFLGSGLEGGGASSAITFKFPLEAPAARAYHSGAAPSVVSDPDGNPYVAFFYTTLFDAGQAPASFQDNRDDLYVARWDGTEWVAVGPPVPVPGSPESLGAPGGISGTNAFAKSSSANSAFATATPPSIALEPTTHQPIVAWGEGTGTFTADGSGVLSWIRVSEFNGMVWNELGPPAVSDFNGTTSNTFPSVDFYDAGVPVVVWTHNPANFVGFASIYARQYDFNASMWIEMGQGSASVVGGIGGTQSIGFAPWLGIGPAPDNVPFVAWIENGITGLPQVFLRYFDPTAAAPSPTIGGVTPVKGPVGAEVVISGTNLGPASVDTVTFGGGAIAVIDAQTDTLIRALVPPGGRTGKIAVSGPGGLATSAGTFVFTPSLVSFSPPAAGPGQTVTINGFNLQVGSAAPVVKFGTLTAALTGATSATQVKAIVPATAATGLLSVTTSDGVGIAASPFVVLKPPVVTSITPTSGPAGSVVKILGRELHNLPFISFPAFEPPAMFANVTMRTEYDSGIEVDVIVPGGATSGPITLVGVVGSLNSSIFKITPRITGIFPTEVVAGSDTDVTILGDNLFASVSSPPPVVKVGTGVIPSALVFEQPVGPVPAPAAAGRKATTPVRFRVPLGTPSGKVTVTTTAGSGTSTITLNVVQPPKLVSFTPTSGPVGTVLTLAGTGLNGSTIVTFGGNVSAIPTAVTPTSAKVAVPDGALTGMLSITNPAATGASTGIFKVTPRITGVSPASVAAGSGTPVTITGSNLQALTGASVVKIGAFTIPPASVLASSSTSIQILVPLGAFTGKLSVTTVDGVGTSASDLVVIQPPKPTTFAPASGPVGTLVTISGMNFGGNVSVTFGGNVTVAATLISATMVRATVPDGALTGKLTASNSAGTGVTPTAFKVSPRITDVSPTSVVAGSGTPVTITGSNLQALTGASSVKVGAFTIPFAGVLANSSTSIQFLVPIGALTGKPSVTTVDGIGTSAANLLVIYPPKITSVTPAMAPVGALVTINGTNLTGVTTVTFGGNVSVAVPPGSATMVKVAVPEGALTGPISVTNAAGTGTSAASFKVSPKITAFSPASVPVGSGQVITVTGVNLFAATGAPVVKVGAVVVPAASVLGNSSATTIQFVVPPTATTGRISVTTLDGVGTSASDLVVVQPPRVTGFAPAAAPAGGQVTVTGSNFTGMLDVTFNAPPLGSSGGSVGGITPPFLLRIGGEIVSRTPTALTVIVPGGAINGPIEVVNEAGSAMSTQQFKVQPSVTSFAPPGGKAGDAIVVSGFNLQSSGAGGPVAPLVKVNGVSAEVTATTATAVTFRIPGLARTGPITVTTGDGTATSATSLAVTTPARPDLQISAAIPPRAIRSTPEKPQTVSITTTVSNQGPAAAGPFNVAILIVPSDGTGPRVLGVRKFPTGLASAASSTAATVITLPLDLAAGPYVVRAIVDYDETVAELFEDNNVWQTPDDVPFEVFESMAGSRRFTVMLEPGSCLTIPDVVTLTGTGTITQTSANHFSVSAFTLTGAGLTIGVAPFTANLDSFGDVDGTTTFNVAGAGSGQVSVAGFVSDGVFDGVVFPTGSGCDFTATARFAPSPRLGLSFDFHATAGTFDADGLTALPAFPAAIGHWTPVFTAANDGGADALTFVGPTGSNFVRLPERVEIQANRSLYRGRPVLPADGPLEPPAGKWQIAYKGLERPFTVAAAQSAARLVVPVPSLTLDDSSLVTRIDWAYQSPTGAPLATTPTFIRWIGMTFTDPTGFVVYSSGGQLPDTRHLVPEFSFGLECVASVAFEYEDTLGNRYRVAYGRDIPVDSCGDFGVASASTSILTTEQRSGTTRRRTLTVQLEAQPGLVQSASVTGGPFTATPLPYTGTRQLFGVVSDRFVIASDVPDGTPFPAGDTEFALDAVFRGGSVPAAIPVSLNAPPSDGTLPFTGASTTNQFDLATVRGVPTTFAWSLDQVGFDVGQVSLTGRGVNAVGEGCRAPDQPGLLTSDVTEATLTIPATCFGRPTVTASVCITAFGSGAGSDTTTCHVYDAPPPGASSGAAITVTVGALPTLEASPHHAGR